jgi:hypothetical protein
MGAGKQSGQKDADQGEAEHRKSILISDVLAGSPATLT